MRQPKFPLLPSPAKAYFASCAQTFLLTFVISNKSRHRVLYSGQQMQICKHFELFIEILVQRGNRV